MYYYPYFLHLINLLSFEHYNTIDNNNSNIFNKVDLWSIARSNRGKVSCKTKFIASYNPYTQIYSFSGKRYVSYDELINVALNI